MEAPMWKWLCIFMSILAAALPSGSSSDTCQPELKTFLHDLNSQCPFPVSCFSSPIQVDGESFEIAMSSSHKNEYTAVLFYASWCPFSSTFQAKFSTLSYMYPQIKHLMVEQTSALPSVFSRYGIHSVPSLLIVNQTTGMRYHGLKDLQSLVNFYKRTTGLDPVMDMVEDASNYSESHQKVFQLWNRASLKETFMKEPYLILSIVFVLSRAFLYFFPDIVSRIISLWETHVLHLILGIFGDSKQLVGRVLHLFDVKRIWSKLKLCKTRNLHKRARDARVWASSLASVSLGETSSSRVFPSRDL
ncbi:hypothetical protein BUALT_Bualt02G0014900 [Buddleja alternifolia]|uniref:Thioredoxin domain-containing protein n=1 Tax=Buddleja alternifolia TaxID=168488 RepID=A0AAV6Y3B6_9LAMI|nr:hypothetical protein BUALT_Bualt02G0014900 [Buddleja alternifolia]